MGRKARVAVAAILATALTSDAAAATKTLARSSRLGLEIVAPRGEAWCARRAQVEVRGKSVASLTGDEFRSFMRKAAGLLATECGRLAELAYISTSKGREVGGGTLTAPDWTLADELVAAASTSPAPSRRFTRLSLEEIVPGREASFNLLGRQADPNEPWALPGAGRFFIRSLDLGYVCLRPSTAEHVIEPREYATPDYCVANSGTPGWRLAQGTHGYLLVDARSGLCLTRPAMSTEAGVSSLLNTKTHYKIALHFDTCREDPYQAWRLFRVEDAFIIASRTADPQICMQFNTREELADLTTRRTTRYGPCPDLSGGKVDKRLLFALESGDPATQRQIASVGEAVNAKAIGVARAGTDPTAAECDHLAAHPGDPQRESDGVAWDLMDGPAALRACAAAVKADGLEPRLRFQQARAMQRLGDTAAAAGIYRRLDREGYPAASYALALVEDDAGDRGEGVRLLIRAARADHTDAMISLAVLHFANGDDVTGTDWLRQAAHNGSARATRMNDEMAQARFMDGFIAGELEGGLRSSCRIQPGDPRYTGGPNEVDASCYANGFGGVAAAASAFSDMLRHTILSGY